MTFTNDMKLGDVSDPLEFIDWLCEQTGCKPYKGPFDGIIFGDITNKFVFVYVKAIKQWRYDLKLDDEYESYDRPIFPESEIGALVGFINDRVLVIKDKLMEKKEEKVKEDFE